ncbi:conserved hypothetical protein [Altererythrobacter sp. B11]|uniref:DUF2254 domain-containing protein n=1 Tax=Altererythrobacter sp. B11 TaxID=2060312 RepID=UPI000DC73636|nr:DUF2254 domain-containing protein [Altererythrobacter sp. B11]BBC72102.1 conserved hypothetical protein [Altererythrobacter sp. B11]
MTAEIRWFWSRLNANYWFYPALFSLGAALLAFATIWLDRHGVSEALSATDWLIPARPDGASNMLTVIAGSMIGVASTVFSITIAAVAYASGNYGPRLLTNFMEDRGNQLSLATFIATFVYAVIVLRSVRAEDEAPGIFAAEASGLPGFVPQLSLLVAFGLMALSVGTLVYFLNHIPASIRINAVLKGIGARLLDDIVAAYPDAANGHEQPAAPAGQPIHAEGTGYVMLIDFDAIAKAAAEHDVTVALEVRTGDFVHAGVALARVCNGQAEAELSGRLRDAFSLGAWRTAEQDPQFLIDELVEIGLRALSPGINDPFTAITSLHWLAAATAELGQRDLTQRPGGKDDRHERVIPLPDGFDHFVERGFGAMRGAVAGNRIAALVMLDCLRNSAVPIVQQSRRDLLRREGERMFEQAQLALKGPDFADVEARYIAFGRSFVADRTPEAG